MSAFADLTWRCHVCGDERPDALISVYKRTSKSRAGIEMTENVRYCNDRPACVEGARSVRWLSPEYYEEGDA